MKTFCKYRYAAIVIMGVLAIVIALSVDKAAAASSEVKLTYDGAGRLITATYGNGTTISYVYDKNGNLLERRVQASTTRRPRRHMEKKPAPAPLPLESSSSAKPVAPPAAEKPDSARR